MKKIIKIFIYIFLFIIIHFLYDWIKSPIISIFSGTDESVFSHLKISFWAIFFTNLFEYLIYKKNNFNIFSKIFINILVPLSILITWYILQGLTGTIKNVIIELIWAFFVVIFTGIIGFIIEKDLDNVNFSKSSKILIFILFLIPIFFYTYFTFSKPWVDIFQNPLD